MVLFGCGGLSSGSASDGGTGGGGQLSSGGGAPGGGVAGGTAGGSGGAGGGSVGGGGSAGGAAGGQGGGASDGGTIKFASMTVSTSTFGKVFGVSGRPGEVYAVTTYKLFRSTGGGFSEVSGLTSVSISDVFVGPDGAVFVLTDAFLYVCQSGCDLASNYQSVDLPSGSSIAMCGRSSSAVYLVREPPSTHTGVLYQWNGQAVVKVASNLGVDFPGVCALLADDTVAVPSLGAIAFYKNGSTGVERPKLTPPLTQMEADQQRWYSVAVAGSTVHFVGEGARGLRRSAPDTYDFFDPIPATSQELYAVAALSPTELYAGGIGSSGGPLRVFKNNAWVVAPALPSVRSIASMWAADANTLYIAGSDANGELAIDRGVRQ